MSKILVAPFLLCFKLSDFFMVVYLYSFGIEGEPWRNGKVAAL